MVDIKIPYKPRTWAKEFHNSDKRWKILVMHRRAGKSTSCVNQLIKDAMLNKNSRYAYVAPTYSQAKKIAWDMLKHYSKPIPKVKFNEAELRADYPNGSRISLYGAENVDSLRGIGLWGVVFDEYAYQPSTIFTEVISKCLADHKGYAIWIGTPCGKNDFYTLYHGAINDDEWLNKFVTIDDSLKNESGETIENLKVALEDDRKMVAKGIVTEDEFLQEWFCSFEASVKGAYYGKLMSIANEEGRIGKVPYDPSLQVDTYWDLGIDDPTAIWFAQSFGSEIRLIDYHESNNEGLPYYVKFLQDKANEKLYIYGRHHFPHDIKVKELGSGITRYETLEKLGIYPEIADKLPLMDGIDAVRRTLPRCWFNEDTCVKGIEALRNYHKKYDKARKQFSSRPDHGWASHGSDAFRTLAITLKSPMKVSYTIPANEIKEETIRESTFGVNDRYSVI